MRKFILILGVLGLVVLNSCSDREASDIIEGKTPYRFSGDVFSVDISKVEGSTFDAGDSIGIYMVKAGETLSATTILDGVDNYHYKAIETSANAVFTPSSTDTIFYPPTSTPSFIAYYPALNSIASDFLIPINLSGQTAIADIPQFDLIYSNNATNQETADVNLNFNHVLTYLNFEVVGASGLTEAELDGMSIILSNVSTTAQFSLVDGTIQSLGAATSSIAVPGSVVSGVGIFECIFLPGGNSTNSEIVFKLTNSKTFTYQIPSTQEFKGGYAYQYVFTLSSTSANVTGTLTGWEIGTLPNDGVITVQ